MRPRPDADRRAEVRHGRALRDRRVGRDVGLGVLLHRLRLAGEGRLLRLQDRALDEAAVGGDPVAFGEQHDVAGDDPLRVHGALGAVAQHARRRRRLAPQRVDRLLGARLREEADGRVEHEDDQDREALDGLAEHERDRRGGDQEQHDQAGELGAQDRPCRPSARRR
jgi:hypothetical protein